MSTIMFILSKQRGELPYLCASCFPTCVSLARQTIEPVYDNNQDRQRQTEIFRHTFSPTEMINVVKSYKLPRPWFAGS